MQRYKKSVIYANIPHFILVKNTKINSLSINELSIFIYTAYCNDFCGFTNLIYQTGYGFIHFAQSIIQLVGNSLSFNITTSAFPRLF